MQILQIGCGKMGGAMLERWAQSADHNFVVVNPSKPSLPEGIPHFTDAKDLAQRSERKTFDALIVGIKPQKIDEVLPQYSSYLDPKSWVFSMAAGASCARIQGATACPAVVRIMPNLPALIGLSISGLFATSEVTANQRTSAQTLANAIGSSIWVDDEDKIDRVTAVAGSGPGYMFEFMRCYVQAAQELGFSRSEARELVLRTVLGSVQMAIDREDSSLQDLRESVTSLKGTTHAGLEQLRANETLQGLLDACTQAAYQRAVELR